MALLESNMQALKLGEKAKEFTLLGTDDKMHSLNDIWIHEASANYISKHISSQEKKAVFIQDAYHVLLVDKDHDKYNEEIYSFINSIEERKNEEKMKQIKIKAS